MKNTITITFEIFDKDKFKKFHNKVLTLNKEEEKLSIEEFGATAVISSWSNPFYELECTNRALDFALDNLNLDDREICEIMLDNNVTKEEAEKLLENIE